MHLRFLASGIKHEMDLWEKFMQTTPFFLPVTDAEGVKAIVPIYSQLREIKMYDFIFPREELDRVLNTLDPKTEVALVDGKGTKKFKSFIYTIRKLMKLKKIPKPDVKKGKFNCPKFPNMRLIGLGIKEDIDFVNDTGVTQEAL